MDEESLMSGVRAGDHDSFEILFDHFYEPICFYIRSYTRDWDTAQEITQKTFVNFWKKREEIVINSSLKSYLYKMARNQFLTEQRRKKKESNLMDLLTHEALQEYETLSKNQVNQRRDRVRRAIDGLPDRCREVLKAKLGGMKYVEIAKEQGISVKTVESQMRIAYKKLRKELEDVFFLFFGIRGRGKLIEEGEDTEDAFVDEMILVKRIAYFVAD